jgi:hypothetical protein
MTCPVWRFENDLLSGHVASANRSERCAPLQRSGKRHGRSLIGLITARVATEAALALAAPSWLPPQADRRAASGLRGRHAGYEHNHWALSFGRLVVLADQGHAEARRIALQMHHHGPRLYGMVFELAPDRRSAWREGPARAPVQVTDARP